MLGQTSKDVEGVGLAFQFTVFDQVDEEQRTERLITLFLTVMVALALPMV
ncbi:MAG: hypothetical protein NWQ26_11535 [Paraglaciecola sp.]|nr:hypothetical protein [Paraglaciecola sp.]